MPTMTPKNTYKASSDVVKLVSTNPALTRMLPRRAQIRGPFLSWRRPAAMNVRAKHTTAIVKVCDVCVRVQPNSFSSGATNTLQAYSVPSARFMRTPRITGCQRFVMRADYSRKSMDGRGVSRYRRRAGGNERDSELGVAPHLGGHLVTVRLQLRPQLGPRRSEDSDGQ